MIPLSPSAGLLEWVENTVPVGEYLIGSKNPKESAHCRYRPHDWLPSDCRKLMTEAPENKKLEYFMSIAEHFKPVFRFFFLENFPEPSDWFAKRLNYIRSVAANSIVGKKREQKKKFVIVIVVVIVVVVIVVIIVVVSVT